MIRPRGVNDAAWDDAQDEARVEEADRQERRLSLQHWHPHDPDRPDDPDDDDDNQTNHGDTDDRD